jgi:tRNA(Ile)-lysidine synthetase-like protein
MHVRRRGVLGAGERVVVAVSGGADSTALLLILSRLAPKFALDLRVAHFDHMLRTREEAAAEAAFVEGLCARLGLPFEIGRQDVGARARRRRESIEEAARQARLRFLGRVARSGGETAVALGHTIDDRAETVMLNVLRGSGLDGLAAMRAVAAWPFGRGPGLARPLLCLSRAETERYCRESGVEPLRDPTNEMSLWTRNRVRRELMPFLRTFNPRAAEALARLGERAEQDAEFINGAVEAEWGRTATARRDSVTLEREALAALPPAIGSRLVRRAIETLSGSAAGLESEQVERVLRGAGSGRRFVVPLPGGIVASGTHVSVSLTRGQGEVAVRSEPATLAVPGAVDWGAWRIVCDAGGGRTHRTSAYEAVLDVGRVVPPLVVRSRRPGDRLRPVGLGGTKKVQDIMVDAKVPAAERDGVPIVADAEGIVWVAGHCVDERAAAVVGTTQVLRIRAEELD